MGDEIKELKSVLRSLVVSSPTQVDVRTLMRDYRNMMGAPVPLAKYGQRDPVAFLKERFSDCFLFTGPPSNPVLTLIVPDTLKHIDQFVQRQKVSTTSKCKSKRRSVPEAIVSQPKSDLIYKTFVKLTPTVIEDENRHYKPVERGSVESNSTNNNKENVDHHNDTVTSNDVKNFLKKRLPLYNCLEEATSEKDCTMSLFQDDDSGKHTSSSSNSTKALQFEELKSEILELITAAPEGVWCTDLIRLYRERYKRELNFTRFGYTSIVSLAYVLEESVQVTRPDDTGDWLLTERRRAAAAPRALRLHVPRARRAAAATAPHEPHAPHADPDDALPGIDFDPDVFPEDCVHFMESIPSMSLEDCRPGAMLEVIVGEVYSPSHFWIIRLGENYNIAMEDMMDEMTRYYNGPGRARTLSRGAMRVGHYCSTLYDNDWHRSLIVKIVDSDTVKVRHVDYGTVDTVAAHALRPLRREWARLPAQAARARLAAVRPPAAGRRWPHAAAAHFLCAVRDRRLVANVVAIDRQDDVIETLLIDTCGAADVCVGSELIRAGHADARPDSALRTAECYLYPRFDALENGDTPNYGEIHAYLRDGIALDYVDEYRRHVPLCLPPLSPPAPAPAPVPPPPPPPVRPDATPDVPRTPSPECSSASSAESPELATRIPLLLPGARPASEASITTTDNSPVVPSPPPTPSEPPAAPPVSGRRSPPPAPPVRPPPAPPVRPPHAPPAPHVLPPPPGMCRQAAPFPPPMMYGPVYGAGGGGGGAWFGPMPVPVPSVTLSLAECETYGMLARVNPEAAHWYMAGALGRAMAPVGLPPCPPGAPHPPWQARPCGPPHPLPPGAPPARVRPPPGFGTK